MHFWKSGDPVLLRPRIGPVCSLVMPSTVVRDDPHYLILYVADGTPCRRIEMPDGADLPRVLSPDQIAALPGELNQKTWSKTHLLHVTPNDRGYSVYLRWSAPEWVFLGWYVNMQTPLQRFNDPDALEGEDLFLDIVVDTDFGWNWKDEDELTEAVEIGRLRPDQAETIRAEAESVIALIESHVWPFTPEATTWRPDPQWPIPSLPDDWGQRAGSTYRIS